MDPNTIALVPSPRSEFDTADVALGRTQKGKLYRKELLKTGVYPHPADHTQKLVIDEDLYDKVIANFNAEVCDIVQVPVADDSNRHIEDPLRNIGEVVGLEKDGDKLFGLIDVRDEDAAPKLGKTLLGTSAMLHMNYMDTRTGERVGPTLLHALVTNRPYITGMEGYEEVVMASQRGLTDGSADTQGSEAVVFATREEDIQMADKDELIAALRDQHGIDIEALQTELTAVQAQVAELSARPSGEDVLKQAMEVVKASGAEVTVPDNGDEEITVRDVADAVIELAHEHREAVAQVATLTQERETARLAAAAAEVDSLVKDGRILPSQREGFVKLAQEDHETFLSVIPSAPIVDLGERGVDDPEVPDLETFNAEVARFSALADEIKGGPSK